MKLILRSLLKTMSSKLLMEVIMMAIAYTKKKEWVKDEDIIRAIGSNLNCDVHVKKR